MRSLSLAAIVIALALVGYLQVNNSRKATESNGGTQSAQDTARHVETQINAVTEQHMQKLKESADR